MKILFTIFPINQLGGIVGHTEDLIMGLKELGHSVDFVQLQWADKIGTPRESEAYEFLPGAIYTVNQFRGWFFPQNKRIPYKGSNNINKWLNFASSYDAIIWQSPVPGLSKDNAGNMDWMELYHIPGVKNIAVIHDTWFQKRSPHLALVSKDFYGVVAVHSAGYNNTIMDIPKVMILNPHEIPEEIEIVSYESRRKGFLACHYWKKIKRMDGIVAAIPYITDDEILKITAGTGIEWYYMTSKDKNKYLNADKIPLYTLAENAGMKYLGILNAGKRNKYLEKLRTSVDPSWHEDFAKFGEVWLRSQVEAALHGAILIATNLGAAGNVEGNGLFWKANKNYMMVPYDASPKEFGEIITHANNLSNAEGAAMQEAALDVLPYWDRKLIAQQYIDFITGRGGGYFDKRVTSVIPADRKSVV